MHLSYSGALQYVHNLLNYEAQQPPGYTPEVISLDRPRALLAALDNPQEKYPIVHVTGTKGKGSVSALCYSALNAAGYRVGFYLSPHLQEFRERFRVSDQLIPEETFTAIVNDMQPHIDAIPGITYWEVITAIAFEYFARAGVDIAVVEVGLGGRLDATNVIKAPLVSVITSLSFDHMHLLGNTLPEIAYEKAGIIKPGTPVVSAPQRADALETLARIAAERGSPLTVIGQGWQAASISTDLDGQHIRIMHGDNAQDYHIPLLGPHQAINLAVARAALEHVRAAGIAISDQAMRDGFASVNWPGRFEIVTREPYLILDSAHNAESAERLAQTIQSVFPDERLTLLFGAFNDKDVAGMYAALLPLTDDLIVVPARGARAFPVETLAEKASQSGYTGRLHSAGSIEAGLDMARLLRKRVTLATGSLSIVGALRDALGLQIMRAAYLDHSPNQTTLLESAEG
jgi:dihydrofolate synthase / folylpolyglutamate synthase